MRSLYMSGVLPVVSPVVPGGRGATQGVPQWRYRLQRCSSPSPRCSRPGAPMPLHSMANRSTRPGLAISIT
ncbi:protein of unknown function [Paraburkholderia kururiensis]